MIYRSSDYSFKGLGDSRFTQYRCPECKSYHVAVLRHAKVYDASSLTVIGKGEIECQDCQFVAKGDSFQVGTYSNSDRGQIFEQEASLRKQTGDKWSDLQSPRFVDVWSEREAPKKRVLPPFMQRNGQSGAE